MDSIERPPSQLGVAMGVALASDARLEGQQFLGCFEVVDDRLGWRRGGALATKRLPARSAPPRAA